MDKEKTKIKQLVIKTYSGVATKGLSLFSSAGCCAPDSGTENLLETGRRLGYSDEELTVGLGCGNPHVLADLQTGENLNQCLFIN